MIKSPVDVLDQGVDADVASGGTSCAVRRSLSPAECWRRYVRHLPKHELALFHVNAFRLVSRPEPISTVGRSSPVIGPKATPLPRGDRPYSDRSAVIGAMRVTQRVGTQEAKTATASRTPAAAATVGASEG